MSALRLFDEGRLFNGGEIIARRGPFEREPSRRLIRRPVLFLFFFHCFRKFFVDYCLKKKKKTVGRLQALFPQELIKRRKLKRGRGREPLGTIALGASSRTGS